MWVGLLALAVAEEPTAPDAEPVVEAPPVFVVEVTTGTPTLRLQTDGSVALERTASWTIPEPTVDPDADTEADTEADTDDDTEVPTERVAVTLLHADGLDLRITSETVNVRGVTFDHSDVPVADLIGRVSALDTECEGYRTAAEEARRAARRDTMAPRPDLDLLEAQLTGGDAQPLTGAARARQLAELLDGRYDTCVRIGSVLRETGTEPVTRVLLDVEPMAPGEYAVTLARQVPEARWVSGYLLDLTQPGNVTTTWLAGIDLPEGVGFDAVNVVATWGEDGAIEVPGVQSFHAQGGPQPVTLAEMPTTYRHVVSGTTATRRVRIDNPFPTALPATRASVAPYVVNAGALEPEGHFILNLGASPVTVRQRGDSYEVRSGLLVPTPIFFPRDPTGCRIAATGEFLGEEEIDGVVGFAASVPDRGTVTLTCR